MEDFLAGCCCPESPLENRISGFHAHINNISLSNAIHVVCAHLLLWLSMLHVHCLSHPFFCVYVDGLICNVLQR